MTRWEYRDECIGVDAIDIDALNKLGGEGWELVATIKIAGYFAGIGIFKRPIANNQWPTGDVSSDDLSFPMDPDKRKKLSF